MPSIRGAIAPLLAALALLPALPGTAAAQAARTGSSPLSARAFVSPRLRPASARAASATVAAGVRADWAAFSSQTAWRGHADRRTGRIESAEGAGIPWLSRTQEPGLDDLEKAARAFLPRVERLLGADAATLVLNRERSGRSGQHLWTVDFDVVQASLPVEGARVVFRVSHGKLIQMGTENLPAPGSALPRAAVSREQALAAIAVSETDAFVDGGALHLLPAVLDDGGRGLLLVWQFSFRRKGEPGTWRVRVDAVTGEVLELRDTDVYARVSGGVVPEPGTGEQGEQVLPMPFAALSSGQVSDAAGWFEEAGAAVTSSLSGPYVRITDACGLISQGADWSGDVPFGTSPGGDCATASGGPGNTRAARTQFFHVNRAREAARAWLPDNPWLGRRLTVDVNLSRTCNAYWDGTAIHFFRSGGGCGNTGEIASVALHEHGHGLDANDGSGMSPDLGTAEAYGDFAAALATRDSCIGPGFRAAPCGGYGDACTACTGVRDLDWARRASGTPHTVDNSTRPLCRVSDVYAGPCGREGHCESYVASEALWDLAARDLPGAGTPEAWLIAERLWYLSRASATAAFTCDTTGPSWTSDGCGIGSLWKAMRAVDDDDGDLANGTPHSCQLFAAFDRHGIACPDDAGADVCATSCAPPDAPAAGLLPGERRIEASWSAAPGLVYDVYRGEGGCAAPPRKVAAGLTVPLYPDTAVVPGTAYGYRIVARAADEACASPPGPCAEAVPEAPPCLPPAVPAGLAARADGLSRVDLSWSPVPGALGYNVYRSRPGAPAARMATVPAPATAWTDAGLAGGTAYEYRVRAYAGCESDSSAPAAVATDPCAPAVLFADDFEGGPGLGSWSVETVGFQGSGADWRGRQTCPAHSGSRVLRFGGPGCGDRYEDYQFALAQPDGAAGLPIPAASTGARLSFWHRRDFEPSFDGAILLLAVDGGPRFPVPAAALSGAVYDGAVANVCPPATAVGLPVFTGGTGAFQRTEVDLDAACDSVIGASGSLGGCAGHTLFLGFAALSDCSGGGAGWSIDDVEVATCAALPEPLDFYTVPPCRLVDTRPGLVGGPVELTLTGACGIPATARALAVNVTIPTPLASGSLTISPADRPAGAAGAIPFEAGRTRAVHTLLLLAGDGSGAVRVEADPSATAPLLVDVSGYFQ
jgi:hypothetical protein